MRKVRVNEGYELYQIITDFGDPLEIFREGIQNSFDENASEIYIKVYEQRKIGGSSLIIDIIDNGNGLLKKSISSFFDVANSSKITADLYLMESMAIKVTVQKYFLMLIQYIFVRKQKMESIGLLN